MKSIPLEIAKLVISPGIGTPPSGPVATVPTSGTAEKHYRLGSRLARGALTEVFYVMEVNDAKLNHPCVYKRVHPSLAADPEFRKRLGEQSARLLAFRHQRAEEVHNVGLTEAECFLVCDRLEGDPLTTLLRRQSRLSIAEVCQIARQVAEALVAAHAHGLMHGNLTPSHIIVTRAPCKDQPSPLRVKVRSFGIGLPLGGGLFGTPSYLAPEQVSREGAPSRQLPTPKSDQFALAAVIYELLSGRRAFPGETLDEVRDKLQNRDPAYFEFVAENQLHIDRVNDALQKALHKSPEGRFSRLMEFVERLEPPSRASVVRMLRNAPPQTARALQAAASHSAPQLPIVQRQAPEWSTQPTVIRSRQHPIVASTVINQATRNFVALARRARGFSMPRWMRPNLPTTILVSLFAIALVSILAMIHRVVAQPPPTQKTVVATPIDKSPKLPRDSVSTPPVETTQLLVPDVPKPKKHRPTKPSIVHHVPPPKPPLRCHIKDPNFVLGTTLARCLNKLTAKKGDIVRLYRDGSGAIVTQFVSRQLSTFEDCFAEVPAAEAARLSGKTPTIWTCD